MTLNGHGHERGRPEPSRDRQIERHVLAREPFGADARYRTSLPRAPLRTPPILSGDAPCVGRDRPHHEMRENVLFSG